MLIHNFTFHSKTRKGALEAIVPLQPINVTGAAAHSSCEVTPILLPQSVAWQVETRRTPEIVPPLMILLIFH